MSIKFDKKSMIADLRIQLILAMKQLQEEFLNEAKQGMLTPEGSENLTEEQITDIANVITAGISGGAWAAMDEYGTGSKMDTNNPALKDYMNSNMWNPARRDFAIRTRPKGEYINIFGERVISNATVPGINLEMLGKVTPQPPSKAIQTALRWMKSGRMQSVIKNTLILFPYGKYLKTDKN